MKSTLVAMIALVTAMSSVSSFSQEAEYDKEKLQAQFERALALRESGDLYAAVETLNSILITQPNLHRARLELAVTYYRAAEFRKAQDLAQTVLDSPEISVAVKETVQIFLDQVVAIDEAENKNRHSINYSLGFGVGHDDNVNVGPSSEVFEINGAELSLTPGSTPQTDAFANIVASVDHSYRMPGSINLGERPVMAFWQSGASFYRRQYDHETVYTVDIISANTGLALVSRTNWRAKLNLQFDHIRLGDDALASYSSLNPSWTYSFGNGQEVTLRAQYLYREYLQEGDRDREGFRYSGGADYAHRFENGVVAQAGATLTSQDARETDERYDAYESYASVYWGAWTNGSVYGRVSYKYTDYKGEVILFSEGREERERRYVVGATHSFKEGALAGWQVDSRLTYTDNHSNLSIYEFDRTEFSLDVSKRF